MEEEREVKRGMEADKEDKRDSASVGAHKNLKKGKAWEFFATTNFHNAPIIYESYSFFNCTNVDQVLLGHTPIIKVRKSRRLKSRIFSHQSLTHLTFRRASVLSPFYLHILGGWTLRIQVRSSGDQISDF